MILPFPNRIRHSVTGTPGTGAITLGPSAAGYQGLSSSTAEPASGAILPYEVDDVDGAWEFGYGAFTLAAGVWTLTRTQVIESSAGAATAATLTVAALVSVSIGVQDIAGLSVGYLNKFRNPVFDIAQRGTTANIATATPTYSLDGWIFTPTGATTTWTQEYCQNMKGNALRITGVTSNSQNTLIQRIESYIAADLLTDALAVQPITVQFLIYNNSGASITPTLTCGYASAQDNFATVDADLAATNLQVCPNATLTRVAYTFLPSISGAHLALGYQIKLSLGALTSGYVDIGQADGRATPGVPTGLNYAPPRVEGRPIHTELTFCQRYFDSSYGNSVPPGTATRSGLRSGVGYSYQGGAVYYPLFGVQFHAPMRAAPASISIWDGAGNVNKISEFITGTWSDDLAFGSGGGVLNIATDGFDFYWHSDITASLHYMASAEL